MHKMTKKLTLQRETVRVLDESAMGRVGGGLIEPVKTTHCQIGTGGACSGGPCVMTIGTSGTSVINPGTIILPGGG